MTTIAPTMVQISLPEDQLRLLETIKEQNEKLFKLLNQNVWLSEEEAAARLRVSKATIQRWRKEGWLTYYRDGEKIIIYQTDQLDRDVEKRLRANRYRTHPENWGPPQT